MDVNQRKFPLVEGGGNFHPPTPPPTVGWYLYPYPAFLARLGAGWYLYSPAELEAFVGPLWAAGGRVWPEIG